jgi:predicted O-methyltransferase YrrM
MFRGRHENRYWYYRVTGAKYDPPVIAMLTETEWEIVQEWYAESHERNADNDGSCSIPAISQLHSMIVGNNVTRVVQLGHFIGFSTMLLGCALRSMGPEHKMFSIDFDSDATNFAQKYVDKLDLGQNVQLCVSDSAAPTMPAEAASFLGGPPQVLFLDSAHSYDHTIKELNLWWPALAKGGFLFLHDASPFAASFDSAGKGGVAKALDDWSTANHVSYMAFNGTCAGKADEAPQVYLDGCGLGVLHKSLT